MTTVAKIGFSAQFGGRDAAQAVLPHFWALKAAAKDRALGGFPFRELAFILRVDGEIHCFGLSGAGLVDFDKRGKYVSVDIGITHDDLAGALPALIAGAIVASVDLLKATGNARLAGANFQALAATLRDLCAAYEVQMASLGG